MSDVQGETVSTPSPGSKGVMSDAIRAAVDDLIGTAQGTESAEGKAGGAAAASSEPAAAAAASSAAVEKVATGEAPPAGADLAEFQAFARAQQSWQRDRDQLAAKAATAADTTKREILNALQSEDPDGALADLGLSAEARRSLVNRMVLRHVPADKAPPELKQQIENDNLRAELRSVRKDFEQFKKELSEGREKERHEANAQQNMQRALQTLHDAFQSAGEDLAIVKSRYGKRRNEAIRDAIEIGKELAAKGEITTRMTEPQIASKLVRALNDRYREDFGLPAIVVQTAPAQPPVLGTPTNGQAGPSKIAAEGHAARTISRGANGVTRPPSPAHGPRPEAEEIAEMAAEMARLKREGKFPS